MPARRRLSRRAIHQLRLLESTVRKLSSDRSRALELLRASRGATTHLAQRDFWLEFAWLDQEYRVAVHKLATFCGEHQAAEHADRAVAEERTT
jgi:hypothetical protein